MKGVADISDEERKANGGAFVSKPPLVNKRFSGIDGRDLEMVRLSHDKIPEGFLEGGDLRDSHFFATYFKF